MKRVPQRPVRKAEWVPGIAARIVLRFVRAEEGTLVIFALILFVLMTMLGGIAVDIMRYEATRTALQNTLDRSTLAAASVTQDLDAVTVVNDYFDKAGLAEYLTGVVVTQGFNFKEVSATAMADTEPFFLSMIGVNTFDASAASTAEQRITNVEIVMVLDVSGSMNSNNRLVNLKAAAREFVDTLLSSDAENRISIAMVPFNGQVNLGEVLRAKYNATNLHGVANVHCIDLPSSVYTGVSMSTSLAMPMTAHADTYSWTSQSTSYVLATSTSSATPNALNRWCPPSTANIVRLPTNSITQLQGYIAGLTAIGATSINAGMKWGMALLDPDSRPMFAEFAAAAVIPAIFGNRPFEYVDTDAMKVIVLMTDGDHFAEERINNAYKTGASDIYRSTGDGNYSVYHASYAGANKYWVPHLSVWQVAAWNSGDGVVQQNWEQVWTNLRVSYVAWQMYARALGTDSVTRTARYSEWMATFRTQTATSVMNTQLQSACTLAKDSGVIVYGIAFEAPTSGAAQILACSSSNAHFFNAAGTSISTAFRAISSNISQLRLTQ